MSDTDIYEKVKPAFTELLEYKIKFEKKYLAVVMVYFVILLSVVFGLQHFFPEQYKILPLRIGIAFFVFLSLALHYVMKYTYFVTNRHFVNLLRARIRDNNIIISQEDKAVTLYAIEKSDLYTAQEKKTLAANFKKAVI